MSFDDHELNGKSSPIKWLMERVLFASLLRGWLLMLTAEVWIFGPLGFTGDKFCSKKVDKKSFDRIDFL